MIYFYAILSTALEIFGDYLFKTKHPGWGLTSYLLGIAPWFFMLKENDLSRSIVIFTALNVVGCILVGRMFLSETISGQQLLGCFLVLVGIFLT